jgi:hypothetical protein
MGLHEKLSTGNLGKTIFQWHRGDRCYDFLKYILWKNIVVFAQATASLCKNLIITLFFEKNANFFAEKMAKIAENCDPIT